MSLPVVSADTVACLVHAQFPHWADLVIRPVDLGGWDNTTFRLGSRLIVRLPNHTDAVSQVDKEHRWLPVLARRLPQPIPVPLARGAPHPAFPMPWSVYGWLDGEPAGRTASLDLPLLADDVAAFLAALHRVPIDGAPGPGAHNYHRRGPVGFFDRPVRAAIARLDGRIDTVGATEVWEAALGSNHRGDDVWVHGDLTGSNLLVRVGRLSAVIDFGCTAIGDPACDLAVAWTTFEGASRDRFRRAVGIDDDAWPGHGRGCSGRP